MPPQDGDFSNTLFFVYLIPSDMSEDSSKTSALETLASDTRAWYAEQAGNNTAFTLSNPVITVIDSTENEAHFTDGNTNSTDWGYKVRNDVRDLMNINPATTTNKFVCYCEADGGATTPISFVASNGDDEAMIAPQVFDVVDNGSDLSYQSVVRISIHEIGHTLGYAHSPADASIMDVTDADYGTKTPAAHVLRSGDVTSLQSESMMSDTYAPQIQNMPSLSDISSITF